MATYWENSCSFGLRYVSWYKCLIVSLVFSHLGFWSWNLFLIAPFPDLCLLVPCHRSLSVPCNVNRYTGQCRSPRGDNKHCDHYTRTAQIPITLMSRDARKPVFGVSDQVRHKPACTSSEKS